MCDMNEMIEESHKFQIDRNAANAAEPSARPPVAIPRKLTTLAALANPTFSLDLLMSAITDDAVNTIPTACLAELKIFRNGVTLHQSRMGSLSALSKHDRPPLEDDTGCTDRQINIPILRSGLLCGHFSIRTPYPFEFQQADLQAAQLLAAAIVAGLDRLEGDEAQRRFESTFVHAPVGIAHVALDGRFMLVNDEFVRISGTTRENLLTYGFQNITHPDDLAADIAHVEALLKGDKGHYKMDKRYVRSDGDLVWVHLTVALVRKRSGEPDFFVSVIEEWADQSRASGHRALPLHPPAL